jgi:hypothetical protein
MRLRYTTTAEGSTPAQRAPPEMKVLNMASALAGWSIGICNGRGTERRSAGASRTCSSIASILIFTASSTHTMATSDQRTMWPAPYTRRKVKLSADLASPASAPPTFEPHQ